MKPIPYGRQSISEEDIEAVCSVLRSDWLTQGPKVREFEDALCQETGAKHCVAVANGTMALHLACMALGVGPGDVGLTSPISFMASANCVAYCGGTPDFADIDRDTICLSPERVRENCEKGKIPKVVIPVDFAGVPADLPRFEALSEEFGFKLLEDAAHAIGSTYTYKDQEFACGCCAHTDAAIFSFHPVKTITTGEGGAVLTNNDDIAGKIRLLANHGIEREPSKYINPEFKIPTVSSFPWYHEMQFLGFNGRITDIQCALGLSQLKRLSEFKTKRQAIVEAYNQAFKFLEAKDIIILPPWPENTDPCYHIYPLRLGANADIDRDELLHRLREKGVHCQIHYIPIYRQPFFQERYGYLKGRFPETEKFFESCLSLPLFAGMDGDVVKYVVDTVVCFLTP